MEPALYGIEHSNRAKKDFWGKSQFNSAFPVALACYMRDKGIKPVYISLSDDFEIVNTEISFDDVFGTKLPNKDLIFCFESKFDPYQAFSREDIGGIDLVVKDLDNNCITPLEIKLTVLPDDGTSKLQEAEWGSELVIRPATTKYAALGMVQSIQNRLDEVREIFEPVCANIQHWSNKREIADKTPALINALNVFERKFIDIQKPLLMQPIWKTKGKSPLLDDNAFDIFVWSDFALSRLFIESAKGDPANISRSTRSAARLARILFEISVQHKTNIYQIYTEMAFEHQTDKEFAMSGRITRNYMKSPRRLEPALKKDILSEIILGGGEKHLSPERRFDQTIFFALGDKPGVKH
ncbi:MAG: HindVP family restriction endonuclease [Treponema sp.]|nr:HindVP family restriction endonuclease [Treponema sp.]